MPSAKTWLLAVQITQVAKAKLAVGLWASTGSTANCVPTESAFSNPLAAGGRILEDPSCLPQLSLALIQTGRLIVCYTLVILFHLMFRSLRLRFHLFLSQVVRRQSSGISEQGLSCAGSGYDQDVFPTWKLITKVTMTAMTAFSESGMSASELPGVPRDGAWNRPPSSSQHTPKQERGENRVRERGSTPSVFDSQKHAIRRHLADWMGTWDLDPALSPTKLWG